MIFLAQVVSRVPVIFTPCRTCVVLLDLHLSPLSTSTLSFTVFFHSSVLMYPDLHTDLDNLDSVENNLRHLRQGGELRGEQRRLRRHLLPHDAAPSSERICGIRTCHCSCRPPGTAGTRRPGRGGSPGVVSTVADHRDNRKDPESFSGQGTHTAECMETTPVRPVTFCGALPPAESAFAGFRDDTLDRCASCDVELVSTCSRG